MNAMSGSTMKLLDLPDGTTMAGLRKVLKEKSILPGFHIKTLKEKSAVVKFMEDGHKVLDKLGDLVIDSCVVLIENEKQDRERHKLPSGIDDQIVKTASNLDKESPEYIEFTDETITLVFQNKDKLKLKEFLEKIESLDDLSTNLEVDGQDESKTVEPNQEPHNSKTVFASTDVRVEKVKEKCLGDFFSKGMPKKLKGKTN